MATDAGKHCHAGVPLHLVIESRWAQERLQAALSSVLVASLTPGEDAPCMRPHAVPAIMSALARSAATLTVLHALCLPDTDRLGLAAFRQLQTLTLCETGHSSKMLRASELPDSLRELTLAAPDGYRAATIS